MGKTLALMPLIIGLFAVACGGGASPTAGAATPIGVESPTATPTATATSVPTTIAAATATSAPTPTATAAATSAPVPTAKAAATSAPIPTATAAATPALVPTITASPPPSPQAEGRPITVNAAIQDFTHEDLTVQDGATVVWTNNDGVSHTTTAQNGDWDSGRLASGQQFSLTFDEPGTFSYLCTIHPSMTATVIVTAPEPASVAPTPTSEPTPVAVSTEASIQDFSHQDLTVAVGTTIVWTNQDGVSHTTTADQGQWDSGRLREGQTFSFTFTEAGVFSYLCTIHPSMTAEVTVTN